MLIDLLIIEELLASELLWQQSPESLRREAMAMVSAVAQDFATISNVQGAVLLSHASSKSTTLSQLLPPNISKWVTDRSAAEWLQEPDLPRDSIRRLLIVAPEFDGILVNRLSAAENGPLRHAERLNLPAPVAAVFADKYATADWLEHHGLPTPRTWLVTEEDCRRLTPPRNKATQRQVSQGVLKPRFGAGCDQVQLIQELPSLGYLTSSPADADWVLQERIPGRACSISLIGQGHQNPALILPPGRQQITVDTSGGLHYSGGRIPCHRELAAVVETVAEQFRDALGPFRGWLGLDVVVNFTPSRPPQATIIEVNPRLCTSYIGYRQLTTDNLTRRMLFPTAPQQPIHWHSEFVGFTTHLIGSSDE
jgi:predicted ATP-grasp superfamily ATP-dependent carboligase